MGKYGKFLVGGIIGVAIGILIAPKSGKETRAFIKEKAQAYMDNADVMAHNARDKAVELYSTASDYAGDATIQLKEKIEAARGKLSDVAAKDVPPAATPSPTAPPAAPKAAPTAPPAPKA
ncbi:MAG: YtxH domain-containing protein [Coriobacteriia bacterium]|nr:YtxH domain-containing protein [Coriobacteriia bacterium]